MFIFNGDLKQIHIEPTAVVGQIVKFTPAQLWTAWVDWCAIDSNSKYLPALEVVMISTGINEYVGPYVYIRNDLGWRGVPPIADKVSIIIDGSFYAKDPLLPVMINHPNQETDLVITRGSITTTVAVNSGGTGSVDLSEVLRKLNAIQIAQAKQMTVGDFLSLS